jgi:hypothetical protein
MFFYLKTNLSSLFHHRERSFRQERLQHTTIMAGEASVPEESRRALHLYHWRPEVGQLA